MSSYSKMYRNELIIVGEDTAIPLKQLGCTDIRQEIDFGRIIEYPKKFKDLDARSASFRFEIEQVQKNFERDATRSRKTYEIAEKYGAPPGALNIPSGLEQGGYEWRLQNWGTPHNATDVLVRIVTGDVGSYANVAFITEGGTPSPVICNLSEMFPEYSFWFVANETWSRWETHTMWVAGKEKFHSRRRGFSRTIRASRVIET